ncbi:hypothetical protein KQ945_01730 [Bacillus subtilis subsp. subtilis]|nr:hypothetical protein [Bacillus subtilis subsp. subtilis]
MWFALHVLLLGLPLVLLSLACFAVIVPMVAFDGDAGLAGLQRGFSAWYAAVLVAGIALARLSWDWMVGGTPLRSGSRRVWWVLLAALVAKSTSWWAMLHFGTDLDLRQHWRYLLAGVPLAGCVANLGWLRWREPAPPTKLAT